MKLFFRSINSPLHQLIRVDVEVEVVRGLDGGVEVAGVDEDGAEGMARQELEAGDFCFTSSMNL